MDNEFVLPFWLASILGGGMATAIIALWVALKMKDERIAKLAKAKDEKIDVRDHRIEALHESYARRIKEQDDKIEELQNKILLMVEKDAEFWRNRHMTGGQ